MKMCTGDAYGIGPVWADNAFKGKGAGKAVMIALIEKAKSENAKSIRLNQIAANVVSFILYASLGFLAVECWQDLEGCVTEEQSLLASRSVGFQPLTGVHVRKMEDADVEVCNELNVKAIDFGREQEIRMVLRVGNAWVLIRDGGNHSIHIGLRSIWPYRGSDRGSSCVPLHGGLPPISCLKSSSDFALAWQALSTPSALGACS